jgi:phosphoribosylformylglycinamidine (FGAM) synthase-like enzyme
VLGMGDMARRLDVPVVGGNVSLYNESDEFGTQIKPTPSIGLVGKGPLTMVQRLKEGSILALVGKTGYDFGGSVLDAVSGCGGTAPPLGDPSTMIMVRSLVQKGKVDAATDLSCGGLLAALAKLSPRAILKCEEDPLVTLFSETAGRFLVACADEEVLEGNEYLILGEVGGDSLSIQFPGCSLELSENEMEKAFRSTTGLMRY